MWCDLVMAGSGGRWALGVIIMTHLIAYNETGGVGAVIAMVIASINALFIVCMKSGVKTLQVGYLRATHKFDFFLIFLATCMDILALLVACGALARTMSTCLDAMTGGLARIYILGRNSPQNEPWPDVLGVGVVFVVTGMFMLGLENTKIFMVLMAGSVGGITCILCAMAWTKGERAYWKTEEKITCHFKWLLSGAALSTFVYPSDVPYVGRFPLFANLAITSGVLASNMFTCGLLSTLVQYNSNHEYEAVPMLTVLEEKSFHKTLPAVACLIVITCSGALLDLFPELYGLIVKLSKPDFKILPKQIGYENHESGSPVLAVFIAGSLTAILAFACPLEDMTYIMAGSHLCATILRAFYLLYQPYRPKFNVQQSASSLSYSRLNTPTTTQAPTRKLFWLFSKAAVHTYHAIPKSISHVNQRKNEQVEREWLLLGEPPSSPKPQESSQDLESSILSDPSTSDIECIGKPGEQSDSDSTEDIDAIVDEYRQKVKVTAVGESDNHRLPTANSWGIAVTLVLLLIIGTASIVLGIISETPNLSLAGSMSVLSAIIGFLGIPKYITSATHPSAITCITAIILSGIFLGMIIFECWAPLLFWFTAALLFFVRCDKYCCICLEHRSDDRMSEVLISRSDLGKDCTTSIHIPTDPLSPLTERIVAYR